LLGFILVVCINSAVKRVLRQRKTKMRYHQVNTGCLKIFSSYIEERRKKTSTNPTSHLTTASGDALRKVSLFTGKLCGNFITEIPKGEMKNE